MKRIAIVFALAVSLGGCANLGPILNFATTGVGNPVTPEMLYRTEQAMIVAVSGLNAYKKACVAQSIPQTCRVVVVKLQTYTRPAAQALKDLRAALRDNNQINAVAAFNVVNKLMDDFKATAIANGVK